MYIQCIIIIMMADTKLRSFNVENPHIYLRFKQIQLERGKTSTKRLNELIEKDVKEADPQFKELAAVRAKDAPDIITPNPFVMDQAHALVKWREYMLTLTKEEHGKLYNDVLAIKIQTHDFDECVDHD
jgi:hypothetical protein